MLVRIPRAKSCALSQATLPASMILSILGSVMPLMFCKCFMLVSRSELTVLKPASISFLMSAAPMPCSSSLVRLAYLSTMIVASSMSIDCEVWESSSLSACIINFWSFRLVSGSLSCRWCCLNQRDQLGPKSTRFLLSRCESWVS